jgi:hypothetical protein
VGASDAPPVDARRAPPADALRRARLMPVDRRTGHAGRALAVAGFGVALALGLAFLIAQLASEGRVELRPGEDRFTVGSASRLAAAIEDDGYPLLFQDLVNRGRHLYVHHVGDDPRTGWVAFGAFDPADPDCIVELDREARVLVNACDPEVTYPFDGEGLRAYPTVVEDGRLRVDINELSTTTTAPC